MSHPDPTELDYMKDAIFNALKSDLSLVEVALAIEKAPTARSFNDAVQQLIHLNEEVEWKALLI